MAGGPVARRLLLQDRGDRSTDLLRLPATGVEAAGRWWVGGGGHVALQDDPLPLPLLLRIGDGHGGQQGDGVRVVRVLVQRVPVGNLDDLAEVHDPDLVGDVADHGQVVGDEHVGEAQPVLQVFEQVDDLSLDRHVEGGHGLVEDDQLGVEGERARATPTRWRWPPENSWG